MGTETSQQRQGEMDKIESQTYSQRHGRESQLFHKLGRQAISGQPKMAVTQK